MQGHIFHCSLYINCGKYGGFCCCFFPSCIIECKIHIIWCYISLSFLVLSFLSLYLLLSCTFFSSILSNFYLHFIPCSFNFVSIFISFSSLQFCLHSLQIYFFSPFPSSLSYFSLTFPFLAPLISLKKVCIFHLCERQAINHVSIRLLCF